MWSNLSKIPKKEFIFSKVAGLQNATLLKNKLLSQVFFKAIDYRGRTAILWKHVFGAASIGNRNTKENERQCSNYFKKRLILFQYMSKTLCKRLVKKFHRSYFHRKKVTNHLTEVYFNFNS